MQQANRDQGHCRFMPNKARADMHRVPRQGRVRAINEWTCYVVGKGDPRTTQSYLHIWRHGTAMADNE